MPEYLHYLRLLNFCKWPPTSKTHQQAILSLKPYSIKIDTHGKAFCRFFCICRMSFFLNVKLFRDVIPRPLLSVHGDVMSCYSAIPFWLLFSRLFLPPSIPFVSIYPRSLAPASVRLPASHLSPLHISAQLSIAEYIKDFVPNKNTGEL